ncbi:DinB/UmuC family translesion DNA polymerase [Deinococcus cellulosilyticus]|uniref:DNA polymerase Y-family little finger domain-containing protein n=1 Tax=Deinococcus cellulosilyticus (strain DSM 18568 / NBRC 106333 / KACC 11606 / 5516J-15) TaxID=1223518 RepID=A0A511N7A2_DEIC1|nr:hypothetical protein [Deinococcus cellulosilyticus]GEM48367.1 hypothetical protein DC3_40020 [Deinococcus cellulosilyticus NBRC 106333 = KACC 11606]
MPIVAIHFIPFAFHNLPEDQPRVSLKEGRALHVCEKAAALGVTQDMPESAVRLRATDAKIVQDSSPELSRQWQDFLLQVFHFSPNVESLREGVCLITCSAYDAHQIQHQFGCPVGVGDTREQALIAATVATRSRVRTVLDFDAFSQEVPITSLSVLGIKQETLERLSWLGVTTLGDLKTWSRKQIQHYFGIEARPIIGLFFEKNVWVARYNLPKEIISSFSFESPVQEPCDIDPALKRMGEHLFQKLSGLHPRKLVLTAGTPIGNLWSSRNVKDPVQKQDTLQHLMRLALDDSFAVQFGIEKLEVRLMDLYQLGEQKTLFQQKPSSKDAVKLVHQRFAGVMFHYQIHDPFSQARDQRFQKLPFDEEE